MRVLVTGNLGYIGPVVVRRLLDAGHHVTGVDLGWYVREYAGDPVWPDVQHFADIREPVDSMFDRIDAVVHMAGLSNDPIGELDPALTEDINVGGTLAMVMPGVRNLVISSCSVYGANPEEATEDSIVKPLTAYARAKAVVDGALFAVSDWVSLRLGTVYGYSPGHRLDLVVNRMVYDAVHQGAVIATGNAWRPLIHVEDVADAVLYFLTHGQGIYNIVGENRQMYDLAREVAKRASVPAIMKPSAGDRRDYRASGVRASQAGWEPQRNVGGALPSLLGSTARLPERVYERLPIARRFLSEAVAA